jgi:hypothetical protein
MQYWEEHFEYNDEERKRYSHPSCKFVFEFIVKNQKQICKIKNEIKSLTLNKNNCILFSKCTGDKFKRIVSEEIIKKFPKDNEINISEVFVKDFSRKAGNYGE